MNCPVCKCVLAVGEPRAYETLSEHVFEPNGPLPDKPTLVCQNPGCITHTRGFWGTLDYEGGFYAMYESGIRARDIPGLPGNVDEDTEKRENKPPSLELDYSLEILHKIFGDIPVWRDKVKTLITNFVEAVRCGMCKGEGYRDELDYEGLRIQCPKCNGNGIS